jgi:predicted ATPase
MIIDGPILDKIKVQMNSDSLEYPFSLPIIKNLKDISFQTQVTFIVGENGTGKSTLLEAIAAKCGFGSEGGSKNVNFKTTDRIHSEQSNSLAAKFTLSWRKKPRDGYFFRAETFFNLANHLEQMSKEIGGSATFDSYGTKSLHEQSHGESFLSFLIIVWVKVGFTSLMNQRQLYHHKDSCLY